MYKDKRVPNLEDKIRKKYGVNLNFVAHEAHDRIINCTRDTENNVDKLQRIMTIGRKVRNGLA